MDRGVRATDRDEESESKTPGWLWFLKRFVDINKKWKGPTKKESAELGQDVIRGFPFRSCTTQQQILRSHRNLWSVHVRGGAAGRCRMERIHSAAEITCICLQHTSSPKALLTPLSVFSTWMAHPFLRYLFSSFSVLHVTSVKNVITPTRSMWTVAGPLL